MFEDITINNMDIRNGNLVRFGDLIYKDLSIIFRNLTVEKVKTTSSIFSGIGILNL